MANETLVQEKQLLETLPVASPAAGTTAGVQSLREALSRDSEGSSTERNPVVQKVFRGLLWAAYAALAIGVLMLIWSTGNALSRYLPR